MSATHVKAVAGLSSRQWFLLILLILVNIFNGFIYTIQAPFYPSEAVSKNATATEYGIVFGLYEFTVFIFSLIFGAATPYLGSKWVFNIGVTVQGMTTVLFGFMDKLTDLTLFLGFSMILRFFEGVGYAGTFVALYSFLPSQFPDHVAILYGLMDMSNSIGFTLGPAVGGLLFNLGGFLLPFLVVGSIILVLEIILLPTTAKMKITDTRKTIGGLEIFRLLIKPSIAVSLFTHLMGASFMGFLFTNLGEYMRISFNFSPLVIGLVFGMFGLLNALLSPLWGYLLGKLPSAYYMMLAAALFDGVGITLIGPIQYLGSEPNMITTIIGVLVFSITHGAMLLSALVNAMSAARDQGYPEDGPIAALIPGCIMAANSLGAAMGPPVAGALYDAFGFRVAELYLLGAVLFTNTLLWVNWFIQKPSSTPDERNASGVLGEATPLLEIPTKKNLELSIAASVDLQADLKS